jgi:hypothetical protein
MAQESGGRMEWRTIGDVPLSFWRQKLEVAGSPLQAEAAATWEAARPHSALALAMLWCESQFGTRFNRNTVTNRNAFNLRPRGGDGYQAFGSWAEGIAEWRARIADPLYAYATTTSVAGLVAVFAPGWDANDPVRYAATVEKMLAAWPREGTTMPTYEVAGLGGKRITLPVPLVVQLVPAGQKNQRPGIKRQTPGFWVQHETGNPAKGADAAMHARWLANGAGGQQLSFHFAVDDKFIYQMVPVDEVTWQAADGAGPGNMSGISCELCINAGIDVAASRRNAEALAAGVLAALGMHADRVRQHNAFSGKDCPSRMRREGYWPAFVANVAKRIGSIEPVDPPKPPVAFAQPGARPASWNGMDQVLGGATFHAIGRRVTAKAGARFRQYAGAKALETRAPATVEEVLEVEWAVQGDGTWWWVTDEGHRVRQAETDCRVTVAVG